MFRSLKNFLFILSGSLLRLVLFFGITATVILIVFGSPNTLKSTLQTSNAYSRFIPSLIETSKKTPAAPGQLSFEDPKIAEIFTNSFPPRDLKAGTETVIDSTYNWLNQKTPELTFTIDLTKNKQQFAQELADYVFNRLERLPFCKTPPIELDPLTTTCKPKNVNLQESKLAYEEQIFKSDTFLPKTILTQEDLPKNTQKQSLIKQYHFLPEVFIWLKRTPYIMGALLIWFALDFIWLSPRKRKGIVSFSKVLISSGVSILVFPLLFSYVIPYVSGSLKFDLQTGDGTQKIFSEIIDALVKQVDVLFIVLGAVIAIIGFLIYSAERLSRPTTKYGGIEKKSGLASSNKKPEPSPKSLRGKLSQENVPLQSSDAKKTKKVKGDAKYRTLLKKREF